MLLLHQCAKLCEQLSKAVGKGRPPKLVLTSAAIVVILFFYVFALGSFLHIGISRLENRTTALTFFDTHVVNEYVDNIIIASGIVILLAIYFEGTLRIRILAPVMYGAVIIAVGLLSITLQSPIVLISAPVVVLLVLFRINSAQKSSNKIRDMILTLSSNYFAITVIALSIVSVIISFAPFSFSPFLKTDESSAHDYVYQIFILFSTFSSVILLLLLGCFPVKLLINELITKKLHDNTNTKNSFRIAQEVKQEQQRPRVQRIVYLSIFIALAAFLALIPHQPFVNKDNQQIGVDTIGYVTWINELGKSNDAGEFLYQAFVVLGNGDRPLSLIILFAAGQITSSDLTYTLEHLPVILGPILVLVVYFLTRELTAKKDDTSALMASFLTAVSFHVLIGIFAGYYANWIALIFGYSAFLFLVRFLKTSAVLNLIPFSALMLLLLFSHLYTWTIITIVMAAYLAIMLKFKFSSFQRRDIILLLVVLSAVVVIDIGKMQATNSASGIELDLQIATQASGFDRFAERWENLDYTLRSHVGGLFNNFIIFSLGLFWLYKSNWRNPSTILIMVFLSIGVLPVLFGNWLVQARVFYEIPFQIPAGIALATMMMKNKEGRLLSLSICVWLVAMSINSVLNFYRDPL